MVRMTNLFYMLDSDSTGVLTNVRSYGTRAGKKPPVLLDEAKVERAFSDWLRGRQAWKYALNEAVVARVGAKLALLDQLLEQATARVNLMVRVLSTVSGPEWVVASSVVRLLEAECEAAKGVWKAAFFDLKRQQKVSLTDYDMERDWIREAEWGWRHMEKAERAVAQDELLEAFKELEVVQWRETLACYAKETGRKAPVKAQRWADGQRFNKLTRKWEIT